jgi:DNA repair exonuclease SbcCD nuclease subunit
MKVILLGDTHFGIKQFSMSFFDNQIKFFKNQLFPYMKKNKIDTIWQLGDFFDHRTTADIRFLKEIKEQFFDELVANGFYIHTLVGNHDIFHRQSREITLIEQFAQLYSENFKVYKERTYVDICKQKCYIVPWIVHGEPFEYKEIKDVDAVLGHFEIANFEMVKGHLSQANLTSEFFSKGTRIKNVFSGHYHIKNSNGFINYLGSPYQLNWGDYNLENGFYVWDGKDPVFFQNQESLRYIKLKYDDSTKKPLEIKGLTKKSINCNLEEFKKVIPELVRNELKFFINKSIDRAFDEYIHELKKHKDSFSVIDNQSISLMIETSYIDSKENRPSTKHIITETIMSSRPDLEPILLEIFQEVEQLTDAV